ncbi:unnamed protein product [Parnassius apollo]|uniref:(apollo) hypothetical protein n=1 Tax=Parnassius apollo TaxID=110799 RepID=A0A8S3XSL5_PARAO|nr:unnamed protein product [Parnassius apollo]
MQRMVNSKTTENKVQGTVDKVLGTVGKVRTLILGTTLSLPIPDPDAQISYTEYPPCEPCEPEPSCAPCNPCSPPCCDGNEVIKIGPCNPSERPVKYLYVQAPQEVVFVTSIPINEYYAHPGQVCYLIDNSSSQQNDNPLEKQMLLATYSQPLNMVAESNNKNRQVNYNSPASSTSPIAYPSHCTDERRSNILSTLFSIPATVANSLLNGEITV